MYRLPNSHGIFTLRRISDTSLLITSITAVHGQNILHRDIKPGNLLINKEKVLRITDFGLSRTLAGDDGMMARTTRGTRQFMAPEMFENLRSNGREKYEAWPTDIWSMGVTLFLMWNGDVPFPMPKNWNQPNFKVRAPFKDGTPRLLKELLDKMLEQDSAKRIKMEELRVSFPSYLSKSMDGWGRGYCNSWSNFILNLTFRVRGTRGSLITEVNDSPKPERKM